MKALITVLLFTSCIALKEEEKSSKLIPYIPSNQKIKSFDFANSKDAKINGFWYLVNGEVAKNIRLNFYTKEGGTLLGSTLTNIEGYYNYLTRLPVGTNSIFISSEYIGSQVPKTYYIR